MLSFSIRKRQPSIPTPAPQLNLQLAEENTRPVLTAGSVNLVRRRTSSQTLVQNSTGENTPAKQDDGAKIKDSHDAEVREISLAKMALPQRPLFPEAPSDYIIPGMTSPAQRRLARLPAEVWATIAGMLSPADAASLAYTSKTLRFRLGSQPWSVLADTQNVKHKQDFLSRFDHLLPRHLYCFHCASYHLRLQPGQERLYPTWVDHPVFACAHARNLPLPRTRLAHGRELPYNLVQLALRGKLVSPEHGIPLNALSRGWKCRDSEWAHRTMFHVHKGRLLMRCASTCFAQADLTPSQQRLLLFSRSEYAPYFSVCDHWQHGDLMHLAKCALSHIPKPKQNLGEQLRKGPRIPSKSLLNPNLMPKQCDECKPIRRCPACPTEYMIEIKIVEDRKDLDNRFKHAICVTRWSDLGDGSSPKTSPEWAACNGQLEFDSFAAIEDATISSHFEGAVSNYTPGQRCLSLWSTKRVDDVY